MNEINNSSQTPKPQQSNQKFTPGEPRYYQGSSYPEKPYSQPPKKSRKRIWILVVVLILLVVGSSCYWYFFIDNRGTSQPVDVNQELDEDKDSDISDSSEEVGSEVSKSESKPEGNVLTIGYEYKLESLGTTFPEIYDKKLVRISKTTGEKEVLVQSIKTEISGLKAKDNLTLMEYAAPSGSDYVFFAEILSDTDAGMSALYSFNVNTNKFKKLDISKYLETYCVELAPDKKRVATASDDNPSIGKGLSQKLYLLDLEKDTAKQIVTLSGSETLNKGISGLGSMFDVKWKDDKIIEYAVYNQSTLANNLSTGLDEKQLIEKRTVIID